MRANDTEYKAAVIDKYLFMKASGRCNYIIIQRASLLSLFCSGRRYGSFEHAKKMITNPELLKFVELAEMVL